MNFIYFQVLQDIVKEVNREINPAGLESVTSTLQTVVARKHFRGGSLIIKCRAHLDKLYDESQHITITEPANNWFATSNLYLTSGENRFFFVGSG